MANPELDLEKQNNMPSDKDKIAGYRAAIREHIEKYEQYFHEKEYALKTIHRIQERVKNLLNQHPNWSSSWEDDWRP